MRLFYHGKDGGKLSTVEGFWLIEIKPLFSVALLKFNEGSREAFHTHAFHAVSWYLFGDATEYDIDGTSKRWVGFCFPKITLRNKFHKVYAHKPTYVLTLRGPWVDRWKEFLPRTKEYLTLTHGRKVISTELDTND